MNSDPCISNDLEYDMQEKMTFTANCVSKPNSFRKPLMLEAHTRPAAQTLQRYHLKPSLCSSPADFMLYLWSIQCSCSAYPDGQLQHVLAQQGPWYFLKEHCHMLRNLFYSQERFKGFFFLLCTFLVPVSFLPLTYGLSSGTL